MKIRKRAEQKNFRVDTDYYTRSQIVEMEDKHIISDLEKIYPDTLREEAYVVFCSDCSEIKVIYDEEFGSYLPVAIHESGIAIHVSL